MLQNFLLEGISICTIILLNKSNIYVSHLIIIALRDVHNDICV